VSDDVYWDATVPHDAPNQFADAMVVHDGMLYVGGNFQTVGEVTVNYIARFDGRRWESLSGGIGRPNMGLVHTLDLGDDMLYVGGMFDQIGLFRMSNIAAYDITLGRWRSLGQGTDRAVRRVRIAGDGDVYIVGEFTQVDGTPSPAVARFDGNRWYSLGTGLEVRNQTRGRETGARAMALAPAPGGGMYVGGFFDHADGVPCSNVAYWDGSQFHPLATGANGLVTYMTVYRGQLYAGGPFTQAGGIIANSIARWDGIRWHALGSGIGGPGSILIRSIRGEGDCIYVGGEFALAGSASAGNIAIWDGGAWNPLGSGTNDEVKSMIRYRDALYVAGNFTSVGGKDRAFLSRWVEGVVEFAGVSARPGPEGVAVEWELRAWAPVDCYRVMRGNSTSETMEEIGVVESADATAFLDAGVRAGESYAYRVVAVRSDGGEVMSEAATATAVIPALSLEQNRPNPFNPITTITYSVDAAAPVRLTIHDARGRLVRTLVDATVPAGTRSVEWDGRDQRGTPAASGLYFYRLEAGGEVRARKMVLLK
jgi:hypothetical protein